MKLWGTAVFRAVGTPELLLSRGFWAAICIQEEVWGLSGVGVVEKEAHCIYLIACLLGVEREEGGCY